MENEIVEIKPKQPIVNRTGRPTKYLPHFCEMAQDYLDDRQDEEGVFHKSTGKLVDTYEQTLTVKLPTVEGFGAYLNVANSTLYAWAKDYPEFSRSLEIIKREQRERLLDKGLSGQYNSTIAKLILSSNHGMAERKDITSGGKALPSPIIDIE